MMGGIVGIFMALFGIVFTAAAAKASPIVALFGVIWTVVVLANTIYNFKNATGKNRYSQYDITDENEESDPLNERFGNHSMSDGKELSESKFCPYCGSPAKEDFEFCNNCGKKLP